jgi:GSCFA family
MDFHLEFSPTAFPTKINHSDFLFLAGSCFTEQIGQKLAAHKFRIIDNPHGILFNPVSIVTSVLSYIENKRYNESDLFYHNELWGSWDHHTRFSDINKETCLQNINESQAAAHAFLKKADWLLLTLGSAFVYESDNRVVANCHKVPTDKFKKRLLSIAEVTGGLENLVSRLKEFNPALKIIFTISPVRHLRDGFVENNRSKAILINSVHQVVDQLQHAFYFPSYELIIDDLRDYRFYAEDMVHPNYAATNYVWEKFVGTCVDEPSQMLMKEINTINAAFQHKPFNPTSNAHKQFMQASLAKLAKLKERFPYLDFEKESLFFSR